MQSYIQKTSEEDFNKARNKALVNEIQHFLNPEESKLLSFSEIKKMLNSFLKSPTMKKYSEIYE